MKSLFWSDDLHKVVRMSRIEGISKVNETKKLNKTELEGIQQVLRNNNRQYVGIATTWL